MGKHEKRALGVWISIAVFHFSVVDVVRHPCLSPGNCWERFQHPLIRHKRQLTLNWSWTESRAISWKKRNHSLLVLHPVKPESFLEICSNMMHPDVPLLSVSLQQRKHHLSALILLKANPKNAEAIRSDWADLRALWTLDFSAIFQSMTHTCLKTGGGRTSSQPRIK